MIRIKKNDKLKGKRAYELILDVLKEHGVSGATVWTGTAGFGKRGKSSVHVEGISVNMPLLIEVVEEKTKLAHLLPQIKQIIGDNGFITIHAVEAI